MAHVKLVAGAEFDLLSAPEHKAHMERLRDELRDFLAQRDGTVDTQSASPIQTDGSGNATGVIYRVPAGFHAFLLRASVDYAGSNATTPKSCDLRFCADAVTPAALRVITNALPNVYEASRSHAPLFRPGQQIVLSCTGGPASTGLYATVQVLLVPTRGHVAIAQDR